MANITVAGNVVEIQILGSAPTVSVTSAYAALIGAAYKAAESTNSAVTTVASATFVAPDDDSYLIIDIPVGDTATVASNHAATTNYLFTGGGDLKFTASGSTNISAGNIFLAGTGEDSLNVTGNFTVYDPGVNDLTFLAGSPTLNATGKTLDRVTINDATMTIQASGAATIAVSFAPNAGGTLDFINNSDQAATIYTGAYSTPGGENISANNAVTAFGGAGGGFYVGGLAGNNSLVGGAGVVTLVGAGNNDYLEANSNLGTNVLFGGAGAETLIGSSVSGANDFNVGLDYVGIGTIAGVDVVSTAGTGTQRFTLGNGSFTLTGSQAVSSGGAFSNIYDVVRDTSSGSPNITVTNFSAHDIILLTNASETAGSSSFQSINSDHFGGTQITLTDNTVIDLRGINPDAASTVSGAHGIIGVILK